LAAKFALAISREFLEIEADVNIGIKMVLLRLIHCRIIGAVKTGFDVWGNE